MTSHWEEPQLYRAAEEPADTFVPVGLIGRDERAIRDPAAVVVANASVAATGLILGAISARVLGPSGRGELAIILQLSYIFGPLLLLGTDRLLIVEDHPDRFGRHRAFATRVSAAVIVLCSTTALCLALAGLRHLAALTLATLVLVLAQLAFRSTQGLLIGSGRASGLMRVQFSAGLAGVLLGLVLVLVGADQVALWAIPYGTVTVTGWLAWRSIAASTSRSAIRDHRRRGAPFAATTIGTMVALRSDRLILPIFATTAALGEYVAAATLMEVAVWPALAAGDVWAGLWRRRIASGRPVFSRSEFLVLGSVLLTLLGGTALLADTLVQWVFGPEFTDSARLVAWLAPAAAMLAVSRLGLAYLAATGRSRTGSRIDLASAIIAVGCYFALIPVMSAEGAALGSAIAYTFGAFGMVLSAAKSRPARAPEVAA